MRIQNNLHFDLVLKSLVGDLHIRPGFARYLSLRDQLLDFYCENHYLELSSGLSRHLRLFYSWKELLVSCFCFCATDCSNQFQRDAHDTFQSASVRMNVMCLSKNSLKNFYDSKITNYSYWTSAFECLP